MCSEKGNGKFMLTAIISISQIVIQDYLFNKNARQGSVYSTFKQSFLNIESLL